MQSLYRNLPDYIKFGSIYFKTIFCQEELNKEKRPQRKKKSAVFVTEYLLVYERIIA